MAKLSVATLEKMQDVVLAIKEELGEIELAILAFDSVTDFEKIEDTDELEENFIDLIGSIDTAVDVYKNIRRDAEEVADNFNSWAI